MQISWDIQFPNGYRVRGESSKLTRVECAPADGWAAASISRLLGTPCLPLETASESVRYNAETSLNDHRIRTFEAIAPAVNMRPIKQARMFDELDTVQVCVSTHTIDKGKIDSCLESSLIR